ncbi:MAG TPA: NAD(P)-dependent oxidoreductase [Streptosporangiaceae bacterium]
MTDVSYGFIGLGQMGAPMAGRARPATVYDVRAEAMKPLVDAGARAAGSPAEVARAAEVISVMVRDDAQVRDVVAEILASAPRGTVVAIHSTIRAGTAERLAEQAAPYGIDVVDAPVTGGFMGAHDGRLAVMAGGTAAAVERCRGPFGAFADLVVHVGPVGAGTRAKLARNLLHFVAFTAAGEAQRLAEAAGLDPRALGKVVRHSDAVTGGPGAIMLRATTAPLSPADDWYGVMEHVRELGEKDLALALELGDDLGIDLPLARLALDGFARSLGLSPGLSANTEDH